MACRRHSPGRRRVPMYRSRSGFGWLKVRRWQAYAVAGVAVVVVGAGWGIASAGETVPTVNCPQVAVDVAVPAQQRADVQSNLKLLNTQIDEANQRLRSTVGQGGAHFIDNAILGPLKDKRFATINRIETAIGRNAPKPDLNAEGLSACTLNKASTPAAPQSPPASVAPAPSPPAPAPSTQAPAPAQPGAKAPAGSPVAVN